MVRMCRRWWEGGAGGGRRIRFTRCWVKKVSIEQHLRWTHLADVHWLCQEVGGRITDQWHISHIRNIWKLHPCKKMVM